jgi:hypothetical protein
MNGASAAGCASAIFAARGCYCARVKGGGPVTAPSTTVRSTVATMAADMGKLALAGLGLGVVMRAGWRGIKAIAHYNPQRAVADFAQVAEEDNVAFALAQNPDLAAVVLAAMQYAQFASAEYRVLLMLTAVVAC